MDEISSLSEEPSKILVSTYLGILSQENASLETSQLFMGDKSWFLHMWRCKLRHPKLDRAIHENKENGIPFCKCFHTTSEAHTIEVFKVWFFWAKIHIKLQRFWSETMHALSCSQIFTEKLLFYIPCRSAIIWLIEKGQGQLSSSRESRLASKKSSAYNICTRMVKVKVFAI